MTALSYRKEAALAQADSLYGAALVTRTPAVTLLLLQPCSAPR